MIELVIDQRRRSLGGFEVGRVLPFAKRRMVGPFIFFDHMGPTEFPPGISPDVDVRPHPHIGLSTITYLFAGEIMHRDSVGSEQPIRPGEVNWMTSGSGITHSERFERGLREGGPLNGIQAWVALPREDEGTDPSFAHYETESLPTFDEGGVSGRLIAGEALGLKASVKTHSPLFYLTGSCKRVLVHRCPRNSPSARSTWRPSVSAVNGWDMVRWPSWRPVKQRTLRPRNQRLSWPLAASRLDRASLNGTSSQSSKERIQQAKADWRAGRMKLPDLDNKEWIPLPPDPPPPC
jgi:redox-sensitive bicupin YhaK (pirin superfamily)